MADSNESAWQPLEGIDPQSAIFPARASLAGEGIVVVRTRDGLRGVERTCPHQKTTMMDAVLMANETAIRCARHSYIFRLADGKGINCPAYRLKVFEVKQENGVLFARATDPPGV